MPQLRGNEPILGLNNLCQTQLSWEFHAIMKLPS
jgi:hypothetical protein